MDYMIRARISVRNDVDLAALLEAEKIITASSVKSGRLDRMVFDDKFDVFSFEGRTDFSNQALEIYAALKKAMVDHSIPGWIGWHLCRHDSNENTCSWNEEFEIGGAST